jgi:hypothetical protein
VRLVRPLCGNDIAAPFFDTIVWRWPPTASRRAAPVGRCELVEGFGLPYDLARVVFDLALADAQLVL